ncbi:MAG: adenosine-specific kinase [Actinomycetota bacterium]
MGGIPVELSSVAIDKPEDVNLIFGQAHFIKTVEDLAEVMVGAVPGVRFGVAFCESSGPRLVRHTGNDAELEQLAVKNARAIGAGHTFLLLMRNAFPVNVLNAVKAVPEVCSVYAATANPLNVIVAQIGEGRAVLGVADGGAPLGVEGEEEIAERKALLRKFGYKA